MMDWVGVPVAYQVRRQPWDLTRDAVRSAELRIAALGAVDRAPAEVRHQVRVQVTDLTYEAPR